MSRTPSRTTDLGTLLAADALATLPRFLLFRGGCAGARRTTPADSVPGRAGRCGR